MDGMMELRCKSCGAPIDIKGLDPSAPFVTCSYCGTSQQRIDAEKYMDDMMTQIKSWLSNAMPVGFGASSSAENVDPVARHSIFINDVRPRIEAELNTYKFSNLSLLGNPLIAPPFNTASICSLEHSPNKVFELNAKAKSVSPLAVTDEDKALLTEANGITQSYALALNNAKLLTEAKDGRWSIMASNFSSSAESLAELPDYVLAKERYEALAEIADGFAKFMSGDLSNVEYSIDSGKQKLATIKDKVFGDPKLGIMYMGIEQEMNICDIVSNISKIVYSMGGDPMQMMNIVKDVMNAKPAYDPKWTYLLNNQNRYREIFDNISKAIASKRGENIPIADGDGDVLMPFWEVDLRYTFVTGKLLSKKSVEVKEDLLICTDFALSKECLTDPASSLTDIFKIRPQSGIINTIKGKEASISSGQGIGRIQDSVKMRPANGKKIVLPLTTKREAEKMCVEYLAQRTHADEQFKLSNPEVQRIMYVPCKLVNGSLQLPADFGLLVPSHISKMSQGQVFII